MTVQLLSLDEYDKLLHFVQENEQNKKQYLKEEFFKSPVLLRNLIFNSQLVVIRNTEGGHIDKVFSVIAPPTSGTCNFSLTTAAIYDDADFIKASIEVINELLIDEKFTKIKTINENGTLDCMVNTILSCGFIKETAIETKEWNQCIYSYFFGDSDKIMTMD